MTGILVFAEEAGCAAALGAAADGAMLKLEPSPAPPPAGLKSWVAAHKATFPGNKASPHPLLPPSAPFCTASPTNLSLQAPSMRPTHHSTHPGTSEDEVPTDDYR